MRAKFTILGFGLALMLSVAFGALGGTAARAQTPEDSILDQLDAQGFHVVSRDRTWLGRVMIVAESDVIRREIVFNPGTGEIFRDYSVLLAVLESLAKPEGPKGSATRPAAAAASQANPDSAAEQDGKAPAPDALVTASPDSSTAGSILPEPVMIEDGSGE